MYNVIGKLEGDDKYKLIEEILRPSDMNFVVTPKEIDDIITNTSEVVANSINIALNQTVLRLKKLTELY